MRNPWVSVTELAVFGVGVIIWRFPLCFLTRNIPRPTDARMGKNIGPLQIRRKSLRRRGSGGMKSKITFWTIAASVLRERVRTAISDA
jgi:hypothetical protein